MSRKNTQGNDSLRWEIGEVSEIPIPQTLCHTTNLGKENYGSLIWIWGQFIWTLPWLNYHSLARWWLNQPIWKALYKYSQIESFPQAIFVKELWNQHLDPIGLKCSWLIPCSSFSSKLPFMVAIKLLGQRRHSFRRQGFGGIHAWRWPRTTSWRKHSGSLKFLGG